MGCGASSQTTENPNEAHGALCSALQRHNIKTVVLVRHAKTEPRDPEKIAEEWGQEAAQPHANAWMLSDLSRQLTDEGREQCAAAKKKWFGQYKPFALGASEALRAKETRDLIGADSSAVKLCFKSLHPSRSNAPNCERMFDSLGYASLDKYFKSEVDAKKHFAWYGREVCKEIQTILVGYNQPSNGDSLFIFGHAVFLNAVALSIAGEMGMSEAAKGKITALDLGEAEGIALVDGTAVTHLTSGFDRL